MYVIDNYLVFNYITPACMMTMTMVNNNSKLYGSSRLLVFVLTLKIEEH